MQLWLTPIVFIGCSTVIFMNQATAHPEIGMKESKMLPTVTVSGFP